MVPGVIVAAHGAGHVVVVNDWVHHGSAGSIVRTSSAVVLLAAAVATGAAGVVSAVLGAAFAIGTHALAFSATNYLD